MRTDPTDTGGLFIGRRPGWEAVRPRGAPGRGSVWRRRANLAVAGLLAALMAIVNVLLWGPIPAGALWVAARLSDGGSRVFLAVVVAFALCLAALLLGLVVLKWLDAAWVLARRAAGRDQRRGIVAPMFAVCAVLGGTAFIVWLLLIAGPGSSLMPAHG